MCASASGAEKAASQSQRGWIGRDELRESCYFAAATSDGMSFFSSAASSAVGTLVVTTWPFSSTSNHLRQLDDAHLGGQATVEQTARLEDLLPRQLLVLQVRHHGVLLVVEVDADDFELAAAVLGVEVEQLLVVGLAARRATSTSSG